MELTKQLDLRKTIVLDLKKKLNITDQKAQVVLALDYSGSMSHLYDNGSVQELVERILPLGLAFDDNGEVDFYLFSNGTHKMKENVTLQNVAGYINKEVPDCGFSMGGTEYAPVMKKILKDFSKTSGFIKKTYEKMDLPVYVLFVTDGDNSDHSETEQVIKEASQAGIFFQFVGIGGSGFSFLKKLDTMSGRNVDNANFFEVANVSAKSDDELYGLLLNEFPSFVQIARSKGMIK